jgi:predicted DNA-binding ribbon-helix-helix protein
MDGTAPKAGVDIEPNNNQEKLENIIINNLTTYNNKQGLLMSLGELSGKFSKKININVNSHIDDSSIYSLVLHLDKKKYSDSTLTGTIRIVNSRWLNVKKSNILFNKKEEVKGNDIKVYVSTIQPLLSKDSQLKLIQLNSN